MQLSPDDDNSYTSGQSVALAGSLYATGPTLGIVSLGNVAVTLTYGAWLACINACTSAACMHQRMHFS